MKKSKQNDTKNEIQQISLKKRVRRDMKNGAKVTQQPKKKPKNLMFKKVYNRNISRLILSTIEFDVEKTSYFL
jgi:hypothetical protein